MQECVDVVDDVVRLEDVECVQVCVCVCVCNALTWTPTRRCYIIHIARYIMLWLALN